MGRTAVDNGQAEWRARAIWVPLKHQVDENRQGTNNPAGHSDSRSSLHQMWE